MTAIDKIQVLDSIEKELIMCLQSAGQALLELSKEKTSQKATETHTNQFLKSLNTVESKLSEQINYLTQVSTGQPHEGSGYAAAKVLQMAWHRIQHVKSRIKELEECKMKYVQAANRLQSQRVGQNPASTTAGVML
ncbi:mediator of RNA polymerase II transcription subunit 11 [Toxorhynchites rutilus septentrionalis]|uniref:mediator of RNA polymerase II transcription subunit 11 n=1 Tax=Toxorhynchites rutilus septentrionalis TaxID=329112 RepID=UPI00247AA3D8|nr:mediator of RNA polymerase II transcription subunit 11 [Toxorhynchites rutilus septentrionalis]